MRIEQKLTRTWQHRIENSALVVLAHVQRAPQPLHCGKLLPAASPAADRRASEDDAKAQIAQTRGLVSPVGNAQAGKKRESSSHEPCSN